MHSITWVGLAASPTAGGLVVVCSAASQVLEVFPHDLLFAPHSPAAL